METTDETFYFGDRDDRDAVENGTAFAPKFNEDGLLPVVTQDAATGEVLMVAYMNGEALSRTLNSKEAVYYSRSRKCLWHKGATSGHVQKVVEARTDCDQDVLLLRVEQVGPGCCHAGYRSCFYRRVPLGDDVSGTADDDGVVQLGFAEERSYDPDSVYAKP